MPQRGTSNEYPQHVFVETEVLLMTTHNIYFHGEIKNQNFSAKKHVLSGYLDFLMLCDSNCTIQNIPKQNQYKNSGNTYIRAQLFKANDVVS